MPGTELDEMFDFSAAMSGGGGGGATAAIAQHVLAEAVANSSTTDYETVLTIPLAANKTYIILLDLGVTPTNNNSGIDLALDAPSGATGTWSVCFGKSGGSTSSTINAGTIATALTAGGNLVDISEASVWGTIRVVTTNAGNLVLKQRKTTGTGSVTVEADSRATVYVDPSVVVRAEDWTNATTTPTAIYTVNLDEGTHLVEVHHQASSTSAANDLGYVFSATNATFLALNYKGTATNSAHGHVRDDGTVTALLGIPTAGRGALQRILVTVAEGGGSFTVSGRSEAGGQTVTVSAGGTLWHRPVTVLSPFASYPIPNESDTIPNTVYRFHSEEGKNYLMTVGVALTSNATGTGVFCGVAAGATASAFMVGCHSSTATDGNMAGVPVRDIGLAGFAASMGATQTPGLYRIHAFGGTDEEGEDISFTIRREAIGSGDATAERGFAILEEVQLAA